MQPRNSHRLLILVLSLLLLLGFALYLDVKYSRHDLTFAMLDVGQGDGLFIQSPTGVQVLVDGGPPRKILSNLSRLMSPFDRSIDVIIITNPDQDHIGGFAEVLKRYKVGKVIESGTTNESRTYQNLEEEIKNKKIEKIIAHSGMRLELGGGAVLDVLFPDRDVSGWDTNEGSLVAKLSLGETSVLLTGDSTTKTEKFILDKWGSAALDSDILKVGHHGSRTSSSVKFLEEVTPAYALISVGKDNKYGHPHQEVVTDLENMGAQVFRTDLLGTIIMHSDGQKETFSFKK